MGIKDGVVSMIKAREKTHKAINKNVLKLKIGPVYPPLPHHVAVTEVLDIRE